MADKVKVNTQTLESWASAISSASSELMNVNSQLGQVDTSDEAGGKVDVTIPGVMKSILGIPVGGTVRSNVNMLRVWMATLSLKISDTAGDIRKAAALFEEAENSIRTTLDGTHTDPEALAAERAAAEAAALQAMIDNARLTQLDGWLQIVQSDEARWPDLIDEEWLKRAAGAGYVFNVANKSFANVTTGEIAANLVDNLLLTYGAEDMPTSALAAFGSSSDMYSSVAGSDIMLDSDMQAFLKAVNGPNSLMKDILEVGLLNAEAAEYAKNFYATQDMLGVLKENSLLSSLSTVGKISSETKAIYNALNSAYKMCNMDPATIANLQAGLAQSGDAASAQAAEILSLAGDPEKCFLYCLQREAAHLGDSAIKGCIDSCIKSNPNAVAINAAVSGSTAVADAAFNTSDVAKAAQYAVSVNEMRANSSAAYANAVAAYKANPTEANYQAAQAAYETYNAMSAEFTRAYQKAATTNADSAAGKVFYDSSELAYLEEVRTGFESRVH